MTGPRYDPSAVIFPQSGQGNLVFAPQPDQPTNYDQASGNIIQLPGPLAAVQNALAGVANFRTNKQNEALQHLARLKGLVDANILPQEVFSHPDTQALFAEAGITGAPGTAVLPKVSDRVAPQEDTQLAQMNPEAQRKKYGITPNTVAAPQEKAGAAIAEGDQTAAEAIQKRLKTDQTFQRDVQEAQMGTSNIRIERIRAAAEIEAAKERAGAQGAGKNYRILALYGTLYENAQREYAAAAKDYNDNRDKQVQAEYSQWQLSHGSQANQIDPKTGKSYGEAIKDELMKTYDNLHGGPPSIEASMDSARNTLQRLTGATEEEVQAALRMASDLPAKPATDAKVTSNATGASAAPVTPAKTPKGASSTTLPPEVIASIPGVAEQTQAMVARVQNAANRDAQIQIERNNVQTAKGIREDVRAYLLNQLDGMAAQKKANSVKPTP